MDQTPSSQLIARVNSLVREYVRRKAEARSRVKWDSFKDHRDENGRLKIPQEYREACERVALSAFLAVRSRKSREEFCSYFAGTLCSVPQFLPADQLAELGRAMLDEQWEDLRALTMLALSASSRV